jgi:hypothetical protein
MYCINKENEMDKQFLPFIFCIIAFGSLCAFIGKSYASDRQCTVTITDMRGVQHVIKGVADE